MSILELSRRQKVQFDASNADHRRAYEQFLRERSWGRVNYRFIDEPEFIALPHMIERRLCEYYLSQEFSKTGKRK